MRSPCQLLAAYWTDKRRELSSWFSSLFPLVLLVSSRTWPWMRLRDIASHWSSLIVKHGLVSCVARPTVQETPCWHAVFRNRIKRGNDSSIRTALEVPHLLPVRERHTYRVPSYLLPVLQKRPAALALYLRYPCIILQPDWNRAFLSSALVSFCF